MTKRLLALILLCAVLLSACSGRQRPAPSSADPGNAGSQSETLPSIETGIAGIDKYGNIELTIEPKALQELGFEPADMILVEIGDASIEMPIGTYYSDADSGEPVCCLKKSESKGIEETVLAVNSGNLVSVMKIAEIRRVEADPGYEVLWADGYDMTSSVRLTMLVKQGYADEYRMHQLAGSRSNKRGDYPDLSDAQYANFREIDTTGMGILTLFRSSTPVNPVLNRNKEADAELKRYGIRTVINMVDSEEEMKAFPGYDETYYAGCEVLALNMEVDFASEDFETKLAQCFRFIAQHEGPYLIHCREGKDRTGFAAAILESLMGAGTDEIIRDYMLSYENFYGISPEDDQYTGIVEGNVKSFLAKAYGVESIDQKGIDLRDLAETYLGKIGLSADEIRQLKEHLGKSYGGRIID